MSRIHIATRSAGNWQERLGDPVKHWKRGASAMETAVSWECARRSPAGLPEAIANLFRSSDLGEPELLLAVAEHKVRLRGKGGDSQCDVWGLVKTQSGIVSLAIEAKASEPFGAANETLQKWLGSGKSTGSQANRLSRWEHIRETLPSAGQGAYEAVPFQILQRCAAALIEARRFGLSHAVLVVQAFGCPDESFQEYARFCETLKSSTERNRLSFVEAAEVRLGVGWADCSFASDAEMASVL